MSLGQLKKPKKLSTLKQYLLLQYKDDGVFFCRERDVYVQPLIFKDLEKIYKSLIIGYF